MTDRKDLNLFLIDHPALAAEWDTAANGPLDPSLKLKSKRPVRSVCPVDPATHRWEAKVRARANGFGGCPFCFDPGSNELEDWLREQLGYYFDLDPRQVIPTSTGAEHVDVVLRNVGGKTLVVEYDGEHWHACNPGCRHSRARCRHNLDAAKSLRIRRLGDGKRYRVIRVREGNLDADCRETHRRHRHNVYVPKQGKAGDTAAREMLRLVLETIERVCGVPAVRRS